MIRVTVLYSTSSRFDWDYYLSTHTPLVERLGKPLGMISLTVDRCVSSLGGAPSPYVCIAQLLFQDEAALGALLGQHGGEILADIPNYTDAATSMVVSAVAQ
ncbi:MAG: EthD family reductase [Acidobacteria bacterium]|nr:EthD family reductase [Acidobacteriota bacterium]